MKTKEFETELLVHPIVKKVNLPIVTSDFGHAKLSLPRSYVLTAGDSHRR